VPPEDPLRDEVLESAALVLDKYEHERKKRAESE
jgi:hypothetical protein